MQQIIYQLVAVAISTTRMQGMCLDRYRMLLCQAQHHSILFKIVQCLGNAPVNSLSLVMNLYYNLLLFPLHSSINSSTIYNNNSTNNSTNNLLNNLNNQANNWRNNLISVTLTPGNGGTTTSSTSGSGQKHGAERLFAYLEADGSDPEDYNRY